MKNVVTSVYACVLLVCGLFAQDSSEVVQRIDTVFAERPIQELDPLHSDIYIFVEKGSVKKPKSYMSGVSVDVNADLETFKRFYLKLLSSDYGVKLKLKKEVLLAKHVNLSAITNQEIHVYSNLNQDDKIVRFDFGVEFPNGYSLDSAYDEGAYLAMKRFVHEVVQKYYLDYFNGLLENEQDLNNDLLKQKDQLLTERNRLQNKEVQLIKQRSNSERIILKSEKMIEKSQTKINQREESIEFSGRLLVIVEERLATQNTKISEAEVMDQGDLIKEKTKIENEILGLKKDITSSEQVIVKNEQIITKNEARVEQEKNQIGLGDEEIKLVQQQIAAKDVEINTLDSKIAVKQKKISDLQSKTIRIQ